MYNKEKKLWKKILISEANLDSTFTLKLKYCSKTRILEVFTNNKTIENFSLGKIFLQLDQQPRPV